MNNLKPKIAILTIRNSYSYGGIFSCIKKVYNFLKKYFDPTIIYLSFDSEISTSIKGCKFSSGIRCSKFDNMKSIEIGSRWAFWEPGHYKYNLNFWKNILKNFDYFFVVSGSSIAAYPLVQLDKKFVLWVASSYEDDRKQRSNKLSLLRSFIDKFSFKKMLKIEKDILDKANFVYALSTHTKKRIDQILEYKRDNIGICNFPMSLDMQLKIDTKSGRNNIKIKIIIAVGRFHDPRKNFSMLIRVFQKIYQEDKNIYLYVVGSKPGDNESEDFIKFDCYKNIIFKGNVTDQELKDLYKKAKLMLITSYQEGLAIVGLEAMSHGIPVVSTECGGVSDFIIDDFTGYLVKINDDLAMKNKTITFLNSEKRLQKMSKNCFNFVKNNFSEKNFYSILKLGLIKTYPELKNYFNNF